MYSGKILSAFIVFTLATFIAACSSQPSIPTYVVTTSGFSSRLLEPVDSLVLPATFDPIGMDVDDAGRLYLGDRFSRYIYRWETNGAPRDSFGGPGSGPGEFREGPQGLASFRDSLLAAVDFTTGRLLCFQLDPVPRFWRQLTFPAALFQAAWLSERHLLVSAVPMPGESGVFFVALSDEEERVWPVPLPPAINPFYGMRKVAAAGDRAVVADVFTNRITVLDAEGRPLRQLVLADLPEQSPGEGTTEDPLYGTITLPSKPLIVSVTLRDSSLYVLVGWPQSTANRRVWHLSLTGRVIEVLELPVAAKGIEIHNDRLYALSEAPSIVRLYAL